MLALPATTNATPSLQSTLNRGRAEAARRTADQLESQAQSLRAQADQQETEAPFDSQTTEPKVLALPPPPKAEPENTTYTAQLRPAKAEVSPKTQDFLLRLYKATSQKFADSGNALKTDKDARPVLNTQGQATGRIVNIEA